MGSQIQITCDGCDFELIEIVGCGFAGVGYLVCVCDDCKVFVNRKHMGMLDGEVRPKFRCGSCRKPLRVIAPIDIEYGDVDGPLGRCPACSGNLTAFETGLMWD